MISVNRQVSIGIMLITGFVFAVSFGTLYTQTHIDEGTACSCKLPIPVLIPTFSSLGVLIGSFVYYLMFSKIKETEKKSTRDARNLLGMLQKGEREIVEKIVESKGEISQSRLSSTFGKVKTFRLLETLRKRGVIAKEKYGKTNMVKLSESYREILC